MLEAKSVYVISKHTTSSIQVYNTVYDEIELQYADSLPWHGTGAIDLAINEIDDILFCSYDGSNTIEIVDAKTMDGIHTESGIEEELAGIEYCHEYNWLLTAERYNPNIRVFEYDPLNQEFINETVCPITGVTAGILGICLDEEEMRLYISQEDDSTVKYYDVYNENNEPSIVYAGEIDVEWTGQERIAVGIAVYNDGNGVKYLYSAGYNHESGEQQHSYLIRTPVPDPNENGGTLGTDTGSGNYVVGVDVNNDTGLVYITTLGSESSIRVYDPLSWTSDPNDCKPTDKKTGVDIAGPAGLVVGSQYKYPDRLQISMDQDILADPNTCAAPGDQVVYNVCIQPGEDDEYNVVLTIYLPSGALPVSADPNTGTYNNVTRTYTWYVGDLTGGGPEECFELVVEVTEMAQPGVELLVRGEVESDLAFSYTQILTPVCCWASGIIYVDARATGTNTGVDWENAYPDLQSALARAGECGSEIWVAWGVYSPGNDSTNSFEIANGVEVYGGFKGVETSRQQRDFTRYITILTGKQINDQVVTMGDETVLDGFVVEKGEQRGIYGNGSNFTVRNCSITSTSWYGIYCENGDVIVSWCIIKENGFDGIHHRYGGFSLRVENCRVYKNGRNGIYCRNSRPTIINSMIYENGSDGDNYYGIDLYQPSAIPDIRNNTIVHNENEGIKFSGSNVPDIDNCILWHNNSDGGLGQMGNCWAEYSCITDPNDPDGVDPNASTPDQYNHNITCDPNFSYDHPQYGYYHLDPGSYCVDAGNDSVVDPNGFGEYDIDSDDRIFGDHVDMGADEVACDDVSNPLDWTADGIVNLHDFYFISAAWFTQDPCAPWEPTDPDLIDNWDSRCDLDGDYMVDIDDLALFCEEWLWQACWRNSDIWMMGMGGGAMTATTMTDQAKLETKPPRVITIWEEIKLVEESIDWLEKVWLEDEQLRKEVSEEEWKEFINGLYDWLEQAYEQLTK
jgi:hypothetical protein